MRLFDSQRVRAIVSGGRQGLEKSRGESRQGKEEKKPLQLGAPWGSESWYAMTSRSNASRRTRLSK
jgi:hypothetical protein